MPGQNGTHQRPTELSPGRAYAVGGSVPADRPLTWAPKQSGFRPIHCYVFRDEDGETLIVDTGVAVHLDRIISGIRGIIGAGRRPTLTMTRYEPDANINMPALIEAFGITSVIWSGTLNPLDFHERIERASTEAHAAVTTGVLLQRHAAGTVMKVGKIELDVIKSSLSVLPTFWMFERATGSLMTSDSFGYFTQPAADGSGVVHDAATSLTVDQILTFLAAKFDWLAAARAEPLVAELRGHLARHDVQRICPSHGCVIEGAAAVRHAFEATIEAIEILSRSPPRTDASQPFRLAPAAGTA